MFLAAETDFGLKMLQHAPANESVVVSPLSVIFAMSMIQAGAKGTTKSQINDVISKGFQIEKKSIETKNLGASDEDTADHYSKLSQQVLTATDGVQTRIANAFFLNKGYEVEKDYEEAITKKFSAKVESHDFDNADETAKIIDDFVSNATEGKIKDIVNAYSVRDAFSLIVNAIYFTAEWEYKFYNEGNTKQMFYSAEGNGKELDFMNDMEEHRLYAEDDDTQVLSLNYKDTSYAFNIFLPKKRFGLGELVEKLDGEKIQHLLSKLEIAYISLTIPKMKVETDFMLKEALMGMGVTDMFSDGADLSGISTSSALKISKAAHKAIIEVDEEGTVAAAATMFKAVPMMLVMEEPKKFVADHPFLFILTKDRNPLFMGRFV
ncbi:serine proteinase inhibitor [Ancylostoma ceylanicum]|uniref:Serine proteinase inhibitor n=1 Tax=Ancylostoma ceylanicum TaxID=53326 RepID=A0A0D6LDG8_9BILA|nr:serine proteinase inhibitor [Ancylostoma ceylanicum]